MNTSRAIAALVSLFLATAAFAASEELNVGGLSVGLKFGSEQPNSKLAASDVAGIPAVAQANWNNLPGASGSTNLIYADNFSFPTPSGISVSWDSPNTWASTGIGEENNGFAAGPNKTLMTGYIDTGSATTTKVTIKGIPANVAAAGYDVYIYMLGGVGGKGGGYRLTDTNGTTLTASGSVVAGYLLGDVPTGSPTSFVQDPGASHTDTGTYLAFKGIIDATDLIVEATTAGGKGAGSNPRAPINAIQLVVSPVAPNQLLINDVTPAAGGFMNGFQISVSQHGANAPDTNTIALTLNDAAVTPTAVSVSGGKVWINYDVPNPPLASGSNNKVGLTIKDSKGTAFTATRNFSVATYGAAVATSLALSASDYDTNKPGFLVKTYQVNSGQPNSNENAELILAGKKGTNTANLTGVGANGYFAWTNVINFDIVGSSSSGASFNGTDSRFPGIPGTSTNAGPAGTNENFALEIYTAIEFPAPGIYTMAVNSDDGFQVASAVNPKDPFRAAGKFDGGRGVADTTFQIAIAKAGVYPFRTLFEQGGGGGALEWFMVNSDGKKILLNDSKTNAYLKTYQWLPKVVQPTVLSVTPRPGATSVGAPPAIIAKVIDGTTKLGTVSMQVNGVDVAPNLSQSGDLTTITYTPSPALPLSSTINVTLTIGDDASPRNIQTDSWSFKTGVLPANSIIIEAEDYDYEGGKTNPKKGVAGQDVNVMPYYGGAYRGLGAVKDVDYTNNDTPTDSQENSKPAYRYAGDLIVGGKGVNVNDNLGGNLGSDRGTFSVTTDYKVGWVDNGEWQNYTREIPAGVYTGYSANSIDPSANVGGALSIVTAGVGTTKQTVVTPPYIGTFSGTAPGGWGNNALVPMVQADGSPAYFKLNGGTVTLRYTMRSGDFDWFALVPVTTAITPKVQAPSPDSRKLTGGVLELNVANFSTSVATNTIILLVDGVDVTAQSAITGDIDGTKIRWSLPANVVAGTHSYKLTFTDNGAPPVTQNYPGTFNVNPFPTYGVFVIEAEDFDYNGGWANPKAGQNGQDVNVMPYVGGAYNGLGAIYDVDYHNTDSQDSKDAAGNPVYRPSGDLAVKTKGANINDNLGGRYGKDRGTWDMVANYKMGWTASGDWANYTRTIPLNTYTIWGAISADGRAAGAIKASLQEVTAGVGTTNQTVQTLGVFNAPGSGGWGANELVPMTDTNGIPLSFKIGGKITLRFNISSGDFDYFMFVPTVQGTPGPPKLDLGLTIKVNFQNATSPGYPGYLPDNGLVYTNQYGRTYGWNIDNSANARNRNSANPQDLDERYDTLTHFQKPGGPYIWEMAVPNGIYQVHIVGGDPDNFDETLRILAEDVLVVNAPPCTTDSRYKEGTAQVLVKDGKLTIQAALDQGSLNSKICFMEAQLISPAVESGKDITLSPIIAAEKPISLQWYTGNAWQVISGATGSTLTLKGLKPSDAGNYRLLVVNNAGQTWIDIPVTVFEQPANLSLLLYAGITVNGSVNGVYTIQYTTNLASPKWVNLTNVTLTTPPVLWIDTDSPKVPTRYYRAIVP